MFYFELTNSGTTSAVASHFVTKSYSSVIYNNKVTRISKDIISGKLENKKI